jgi:hypothetical protein
MYSPKRRLRLFRNPAWNPPSSGVVTTNLVLNLDAADYSGSGNWLDSTDNNNDAVAQGTPVHSTSDGGYFDLVRTDGDWFSIADSSSLDSLSAISIEMWIRPDDNLDTSPTMLLSKRDVVSNGYVGFFTTGGYTFRAGTGTGTGLTYSTGPTVSAWQQVVATIGASGSVLFINGVQVTTNAYTGNFANVDTTASLDLFQVNPRPQVGPRTFDGRVGIVRIYSTSLSGSEVAQNYDAVKSRYGLS